MSEKMNEEESFNIQFNYITIKKVKKRIALKHYFLSKIFHPLYA